MKKSSKEVALGVLVLRCTDQFLARTFNHGCRRAAYRLDIVIREVDRTRQDQDFKPIA
jgi:hypothetical protein